MPGLFDNIGSNGGLLGMLTGQGSGPGGLAGSMNPAFAESRLQQQEFGWKVQQFQQHYQALKQAGIPEDKIWAILSDPNGPAAQQQYGYPPGTVSVEGAQVPAYMVQQPRGGVQAQPSQQPQPQQPQGVAGQMQQIIKPLQDIGIAGKARAAGAEETARKQADRLDQYPTALTDAQDTVSELEKFRDNPNRPSIIGGPLGGIGRLGALGRTQADLVNKNDALQSKIMNNLRTLGSVAGRQMTPGMMKELSVGAGDLIAGRKGTVEGHTEIINNAIDLIKKNTQAAWEATGKKGAEPTWGQSSPATPKQNYAEGTVIVNKQTGEHRVMRAGQWAKP